ncbi:MAG: hypothetical protein HYX89_03440, partial [Chloroflexi bacterium]|nr:hypothetical protein [Chloroflexota bacterium]
MGAAPPNRGHRWAQAIIGLEPLYGASALVLLFIPNPYWWVGLAIALVPWGLRWWHLGYPSQRTPFDVPIALFALSLILGVLSSVDRSLSLEALRGYLGAILGYYLLINHRDPKWFRFYLTAFAIIVALVSIWAFDAWATGTVKVTLANRWLHALLASLPHLPAFTTAQPSLNAIAGMTQVLIPMVAAFALFGLPRSRHWSAMGALAFTAVLILTSSRAAWLGLAASLFFLSVLRTRWAWAGGV